MNLLILTQYFPPEVGAPQNRLYELAIRLKKMGVDVTVLTAMPNMRKDMNISSPSNSINHFHLWYCWQKNQKKMNHVTYWIFT